jgi:hypothetical protein
MSINLSFGKDNTSDTSGLARSVDSISQVDLFKVLVLLVQHVDTNLDVDQFFPTLSCPSISCPHLKNVMLPCNHC